MNEHALPVLIAFLAVAGIAVFLLYRALASVKKPQSVDGERKTLATAVQAARAGVQPER
jgi:hypothetical protein